MEGRDKNWAETERIKQIEKKMNKMKTNFEFKEVRNEKYRMKHENKRKKKIKKEKGEKERKKEIKKERRRSERRKWTQIDY
jgi:hypothetical protein